MKVASELLPEMNETLFIYKNSKIYTKSKGLGVVNYNFFLEINLLFRFLRF